MEGTAVICQSRIYDTNGQLIRTLVDGYESAGRKSIIWDGTNDTDNLVSSGIYFCRMNVGNKILTKKIVLMK